MPTEQTTTEPETESTTSWSDTQKLLAFIVVGAFIIVIFVWMFHAPTTSEGATAVLNTLVGTLGGFAGTVITFYFGSSRASANKDQTIASLATGSTPAAATAANNSNGHAPAPAAQSSAG